MANDKEQKGTLFFVQNGIYWIVDPTSHFEGAPLDYLSGLIGIIPTFIFDDPNVVDMAVDHYGMPSTPISGGTFADNGVYSYPEDPDLFPVAACIAGGKKIFIYRYGLIAFIDLWPEATVMYRFD